MAKTSLQVRYVFLCRMHKQWSTSDRADRHAALSKSCPSRLCARRTPPLRPRQSWPAGTGPATALSAVLKWCGAASSANIGQKLELRSGRGRSPCWQPSTLVAAGRTAGSARINCCCRSAAGEALGQPEAGQAGAAHRACVRHRSRVRIRRRRVDGVELSSHGLGHDAGPHEGRQEHRGRVRAGGGAPG